MFTSWLVSVLFICPVLTRLETPVESPIYVQGLWGSSAKRLGPAIGFLYLTDKASEVAGSCCFGGNGETHREKTHARGISISATCPQAS